MASGLNDKQITELKQLLKERLETLGEEIRQELVESDNEKYIHLTSGVNDTGDESVADLLADLGLAMIDHHINELRNVEAALLRIAKGTYGICVDDEAPIDYQRLKVNPTAKRCFDCQVRYEESYAQPGQATL
jgi:RNA polymerase-binding transcription factor DksA